MADRYAIQEEIRGIWITHTTREHRNHASQVFWQMYDQTMIHTVTRWRLIDTTTEEIISRVGF